MMEDEICMETKWFQKLFQLPHLKARKHCSFRISYYALLRLRLYFYFCLGR